MTAVFTWIIEDLTCLKEKDGKEKVVTQVSWSCAARDSVNGNTYFADTRGTSGVLDLDPSAPFIPFPELTEAQVFSWVFSSGISKEYAEERLQERINEQIDPPYFVLNPPWLVSRV